MNQKQERREEKAGKKRTQKIHQQHVGAAGSCVQLVNPVPSTQCSDYLFIVILVYSSLHIG